MKAFPALHAPTLDPFPSISSAKQWGLVHTDGPYSFLAEDGHSICRFTYAPSLSGSWFIHEVL